MKYELWMGRSYNYKIFEDESVRLVWPDGLEASNDSDPDIIREWCEFGGVFDTSIEATLSNVI
jgi:hypothetical protein